MPTPRDAVASKKNLDQNPQFYKGKLNKKAKSLTMQNPKFS